MHAQNPMSPASGTPPSASDEIEDFESAAWGIPIEMTDRSALETTAGQSEQNLHTQQSQGVDPATTERHAASYLLTAEDFPIHEVYRPRLGRSEDAS